MATIWRRILEVPVAIVMAAYYTLTAIVGPIAKPVIKGLAKLRIFKSLHAAIERLGPYPSLLLLTMPIIIIEPLKIGSLGILASGRFVLGTVALVISHGLSLIIIERLFAIVKPKLLTLKWFAAIWNWFTLFRDRILIWIRSTRAWSNVLRVKEWSRRVMRKCLDAIGFQRAA